VTKLLAKAFDEAARLPAAVQDALARALLDELRTERHWQAGPVSAGVRLRSIADVLRPQPPPEPDARDAAVE
jgi:hypothetical protein